MFRKMTATEAEATVFDPVSIMQYSVPASWTISRKGFAHAIGAGIGIFADADDKVQPAQHRCRNENGIKQAVYGSQRKCVKVDENNDGQHTEGTDQAVLHDFQAPLPGAAGKETVR